MKKILLSDWIIPVVKPAIKDAAVVTEDGKIIFAGYRRQLPRFKNAQVHDLGKSILLPGLVNAHTHLEYSCLKNKISRKKNFIYWVGEIIKCKNEIKEKLILRSIDRAIKDMLASGTSLVGEVANTGLSAKALGLSPLKGAFFYEMIGNIPFKNYKRLEQALCLQASGFCISPACHAPHTVSLKLARDIQNYISKNKKITSIHTAESKEECDWMLFKKGGFKEIFSYVPPVENQLIGVKLLPLEYLNKIKFLNSHTLCVHCVFAEKKEINLLTRHKSPVVLCPRSNLYTGNGLPPVKKFIQARILLALGTDSLASNDDLNLWNEMKALKKFFPFLSYPFILRMATLNGARALGYGKTHGSIEAGKKADLIYIQTGNKKISDPCKFLIEEEHEKVNRYTD